MNLTRKNDRGRFTLSLTAFAILAAVLAGACKGPAIINGSGSESDVQLSSASSASPLRRRPSPPP
jgi:hypothetical protein